MKNNNKCDSKDQLLPKINLNNLSSQNNKSNLSICKDRSITETPRSIYNPNNSKDKSYLYKNIIRDYKIKLTQANDKIDDLNNKMQDLDAF